MVRQFVEIEKYNWSAIIVTFILEILAIGCFFRMRQTSSNFELCFLYWLLTVILVFSGILIFAFSNSETKKYYVKTERSRGKVEFLRGGRKNGR